MSVRRVYCVGYGRPCPARAWWYAENRPQGGGVVRKRCPLCHARRRWLESEHPATCACGAPLSQASTGRPRASCLRCSPPKGQLAFAAVAAGVGA